MRTHDLYEAYENGSATALHVRFAGASRGLRLIFSRVSTLVDAEVNPDDLADFHAVVVGFLRMQQRVFGILDPINPEYDFELSRLTREAFDQHLKNATTQLANMYTDRV